jgi:DNA replication protein
MKRFGGFPAKMRFTAIPEPFFSHILPDISDIAEVKTTLAIFRSIYQNRGHVRCVSLGELRADVALMNGLGENSNSALENLMLALKNALDRGTVLHVDVTNEGTPEDIYLLNTEAERQLVVKIESGEVALPGLKAVESARVSEADKLPDIFSLYEENVGMLTPMISDELRAAQKLYSDIWIRDAIREAANHNKRRWSYISAILERWGTEGRTDGTYRGDTKKADPDKYIKGRYGHMVQR